MELIELSIGGMAPVDTFLVTTQAMTVTKSTATTPSLATCTGKNGIPRAGLSGFSSPTGSIVDKLFTRMRNKWIAMNPVKNQGRMITCTTKKRESVSPVTAVPPRRKNCNPALSKRFLRRKPTQRSFEKWVRWACSVRRSPKHMAA